MWGKKSMSNVNSSALGNRWYVNVFIPEYSSIDTKYINKTEICIFSLKLYLSGFQSDSSSSWAMLHQKVRPLQSLQCAANRSGYVVLGANVTLLWRHILRSVRATAFQPTQTKQMLWVSGVGVQAARALINYLNSWELMTSLQTQIYRHFQPPLVRLGAFSFWFISLLP